MEVTVSEQTPASPPYRFARMVVRTMVRAGKRFILLLALCLVLYGIRLLWLGVAQDSQAGVAMPRYTAQQLAMQGQAGSTLAPGAASTPIPTPGANPTPTATPTSGSSNPDCSVGIGPAQVNLCEHFQVIIASTLIDPVTTTAGSIYSSEVGSVISTDPNATYQNADVIKLHGMFLAVADSLLLLVLLITGIRMVYEQNIASWSEFKETIPQVLLALLLSHLSLALVGAMISLNNVLCNLLLPQGAPALSKIFALTNADPSNLFLDFLNFVAGIFVILLILESAVRLPVTNFLGVLASLGCFALAWKTTQRLGFLWFNTFLAAVFAQFLQVLMLVIGMDMVVDAQGTVAQLGGLAMLFAALAIPFYLYRWAIQPSVTAIRAVSAAGEQVVDTTVGAVKTVAMAGGV